MDVDILKTSSASDSSMEMMAMMMQMEKFPELLCEPFYNTTLTYQENEFSGGISSTTNTTTTTTLPIFPNINPNIAASPNIINPTPPSPPSSSNFLHHNPYQQSMTPPPLHEVSSGRLRAHNNNASFPYPSSSSSDNNKKNSMAAMREMIFRVAVMQPIHIDPESIKPPKRRNVKISKDPQSVAARHRRERISERIRILQRLVPGGTKMDTASMLDEAIHYVKFLKKQVQTLEQAGATSRPMNNSTVVGFTGFQSANVNYSAFLKGCHQPYPMVGSSASKQLLS